MNYIENWFHFYDTTESFEAHRKQGLINPDSICFLRETAQIYTQGHFFGICKERFEKLEELVLEHEAKLKNILGTEGSSVNDGIINNIADIVDFLSGFTDEDNLKEFIEAIKQSLSDRIDTLEEDINSELEELRNLINAVDGKIESINIRLDNHDTEIAALKLSLEAHIREFNLLKSNYESFKDYANSKFSSVDKSISALNDSVQSLQDYFEELDEKFDDVENEIASAKALMEDTQALARDLTDRFEKALADVAEFERDIESKIEDFEDLLGKPNGFAQLDSEGLIPDDILPSTIKEVEEHSTLTALPPTGKANRIYITRDTNLQYRWDDGTSAYVELSNPTQLKEEIESFKEEIENFKEEIKNFKGLLGKPNGFAQLDSEGHILEEKLPSSVYEVKEHTAYDELPEPGEAGKIYITTDDNLQYRWDSETNQYVKLSNQATQLTWETIGEPK